MDNINPFIVHRDLPQLISWKHFKNKIIYEFELILPFKAIFLPYKDKENAYMRLCARVIIDQKLEVSEVLKEQLVIMDLPLKTFDRAWAGINYLFKHNLTDKDNVLLKFEKQHREAIKIISYERMEPTEEHVEFSKKHYVKPERFNATIVRRSEEL